MPVEFVLTFVLRMSLELQAEKKSRKSNIQKNVGIAMPVSWIASNQPSHYAFLFQP